MDDDLERIPDKDVDPRRITRAVYRTEDSWPVLRLLNLVHKNWKLIAICIGIGAAAMRPQSLVAILRLLGVPL